MRTFLRNNGLSIVLLGLFALSIAGQAFAGWRAQAEELGLHNLPPVDFRDYLGSGHFLSATFENWESEFLQMSAYVVLTIFLFQKGSPESRKLEGPNPEDEDPPSLVVTGEAPAAVRKGGLARKIYSHSLSLALFGLFLASFALHAVSSMKRSNEEAAFHHRPAEGLYAAVSQPEFWYESFQNWQSEFLSIAVLLILGIYLRQRGSPESKPVAAPHDQTGH